MTFFLLVFFFKSIFIACQKIIYSPSPIVIIYWIPTSLNALHGTLARLTEFAKDKAKIGWCDDIRDSSTHVQAYEVKRQKQGFHSIQSIDR